MLNASALALPGSYTRADSAASFAFEPRPIQRATRVAGVGQPLRGTWRPMFFQPPARTPRRAVQARTVPEEPRISAGWWQNLLQRIGLLTAARVIPPVPPTAEPPAEVVPDEVSALGSVEEAPVFYEAAADPAASFWEEHMVSPGENVQVYGPIGDEAPAAELTRIGRSFLGAYRKGRRAAEDGLGAGHCPYQGKPEKEGRPVNALTRSFQRYWAEGLNDALNGQTERYV